MKGLLGLFGILGVFGTFFLSFSQQNFAKTPVQKPFFACRNNHICLTSPLSIYTTITPTPIINRPAGFCLYVPVLLYHHVQPQGDAIAKGQVSLSVDAGIFEQQMAYLASSGYTTISAASLVNAILAHGPLPPKPIVVTFDDGYLDNFLYAYPVLQKYHLVGNLMVPTGLLGVQAATNTYYTADELKQMVNSGMMFAYDHTFSHFPLSQGPVDKDIYEATTGQNQLQQILGHTDPIFVYPYGSGQTLPWVWNVLKSHGFVAAFSTLPGVWQCEGNSMDLPRLHIGNAPLSSYGL